MGRVFQRAIGKLKTCRHKNTMHELGITQEIIDIASAKAEGAKVRRLVIEIGKLSAVLPDAVRFAFEVCREGTLLAEAELEIREPAGLARCRTCQGEVVLERPFGRCACGSSDLDWIRGDELRIMEMEVC
jgi:hydrogenase nickel incorporation protein HypA/HybF